ncbi:unnamed protein product [Adineta steineri]|uniref:Uncharacterized protein n=1 Tax=Adineta steineri TaxID=433720 RepID=A0A813Y7D0_9BILA|nr:unnamed protein product [Adineta steineri]CAF0914328.1 unnamed protein product [Adineta steineri]
MVLSLKIIPHTRSRSAPPQSLSLSSSSTPPSRSPSPIPQPNIRLFILKQMGQTSAPSSPSPSPALLPSPAQYLSPVPSTPTSYCTYICKKLICYIFIVTYYFFRLWVETFL